jgi:diguanylate cyclase (GGDEF)-like protein
MEVVLLMMKKFKRKYIVYFEIIIFFLIILCSYIVRPVPQDDIYSTLNDCTVYNTGWTISTEYDSTYYDVLPTYYYTDNSSDIWLEKTLDVELSGKSIGFFTFQQLVEVYINGDKVYEFIPSETTESSTPGNKWNFIRLDNASTPCNVVIHITECYSDSKISVPVIYYGTQSGMLLTYLKQESPHLLASSLTLIFGIILGSFCLMYRNKTGFEKSLTWLALYSIFRGLWTLIESNVYSFFLVKLLIISQVSYMALMISIICFLEFVNASFHNGQDKPLKWLVIIATINFGFAVICQYIFKIDYAQTAFISHLILLVGGLYASFSSLVIFYKGTHGGASFPKKSYGVHVICSLLIVITSIIDLVRYYYFHSPDIARFSRWGDLVYIFVVTYSIFANFISLLRMGHKAELIKEAAETDPLTKLLNRSSFERDIIKAHGHELNKMGVVMLDLNNLKHFNDVHGHSMGDYYIIISSEIICDAFYKYGTVYRIGGDEFCVIASNLDTDEFISVRTHIEDYMATLKMPSSDLHMGISAGYAVFDSKSDDNLKDTMKRADELMYQRKVELKSRRG